MASIFFSPSVLIQKNYARKYAVTAPISHLITPRDEIQNTKMALPLPGGKNRRMYELKKKLIRVIRIPNCIFTLATLRYAPPVPLIAVVAF